MADTDRPRLARLDQAARRCVSGPYSGAFAVAESSNPHPRFGPRKRTWGAEPGPASAGIHAGGFDTSIWDARCRSANAHETMGCMCTKTPLPCARQRFRMSLAALQLHHGRWSGDAVPDGAAVAGATPPSGCLVRHRGRRHVHAHATLSGGVAPGPTIPPGRVFGAAARRRITSSPTAQPVCPRYRRGPGADPRRTPDRGLPGTSSHESAFRIPGDVGMWESPGP